MWIITTWQHISPEVNVKGLKMCCTSSGVDESDDNMFWNDIEENENVGRMRMLGVSMTKIKALTMKMETVTMLGEGR
jgi:hypothetical protein